jgi:hypothetical protein
MGNDKLMRPEWQPIETAPRDGTKVLVCYSDGSTYGFWPMVAWYEEKPQLPWDTALMARYVHNEDMWPGWFSFEYHAEGKLCGIEKDGGPEYWAPIPDRAMECRTGEAWNYRAALRKAAGRAP